jgi:invasion protein IalB
MRLNRYMISTTVAVLLALAAPAFAAGTTDAAPATPAQPAAAQATPAQATPATPTAAVPPKVPDVVKAWGKFCDPQSNGHQVCIVRKLNFKDTSLVAALTFRIDSTKGKPVVVNVSVPTGVLLRPGIKWRLDKQKVVTLPYDICTPQTCESQQQVTPSVLNQLRKGTTLTLTAADAANKPIVIAVPLNGFSAAYDMKNAPTYAEFSKSLGQAETAPSASAGQ